jgi:hypothetical protein
VAGGSARSHTHPPETPARACSARELRLAACNDNRRPYAKLRRRLAWILALLLGSATASVLALVF